MLTLAQRLLLLNGLNSFFIYTAADNSSTFDPSWTFSDASVMTINWGDGSVLQSHATGLSHTYANAGTKRVVFLCPDWNKVLDFDINTDVCMGTLPNFQRMAKLITLTAHTNQFSGALPSFSLCTELQQFTIYYSNFNSYVGGCFSTQKNLSNINIYQDGIGFPVVSIDAILSNLVTSLSIGGRVTCSVFLGGTGNAAPSNPAGLANKSTLTTAGWTVNTN